MIALDVLYVALATIFVMIILQVLTFVATRVMYPPAPQIIYRDVPVPVQAPVQAPPVQQATDLSFLSASPSDHLFPKNEQALTQQPQEVKLPEYDPRKSDSEPIRGDSKLPAGLQAVNPRDLP
uniref:Uncharacterized protein n=1 Tax=viral metagenome TaxID=1070528 RepID=A0A6C0F0E1_9ZZZZ